MRSDHAAELTALLLDPAVIRGCGRVVLYRRLRES
jgi:hypothetical protein